MFQIDHSSRKPIYEQIKEQTMFLISSKALNGNDKMPSVRFLSVQLSVNPNTIQRAYTDLVNVGVLYSVGGKGCFVSPTATSAILKQAEIDLDEFIKSVEKMKISGIDIEKLKSVIDDIYSIGGKSND